MNECGINGESLPFLFNTKGSKCLKKIYLNSNNFGDIGLGKLHKNLQVKYSNLKLYLFLIVLNLYYHKK